MCWFVKSGHFARTRTSCHCLKKRMPAQHTPSEATTTRPVQKHTGTRDCSRVEVILALKLCGSVSERFESSQRKDSCRKHEKFPAMGKNCVCLKTRGL
jgi:hypothetical protein